MRDERVLVTTLTKRMAEDLTEYYADLGLKVRYLHSDIDTLERVEADPGTSSRRVRRAGRNQPSCAKASTFPEVSLVAILDADKEGFLRSTRSLDSDGGPRGPKRAWRSDHVRRPGHREHASTRSTRPIVDVAVQEEYNAEHGITPTNARRSLSKLQNEKNARERKHRGNTCRLPAPQKASPQERNRCAPTCRCRRDRGRGTTPR